MVMWMFLIYFLQLLKLLDLLQLSLNAMNLQKYLINSKGPVLEVFL